MPFVPVKRSRYIARACESCRRRKARCDGQTPCAGCERSMEECVYARTSRAEPGRRIAELEERVRYLEGLLDESTSASEDGFAQLQLDEETGEYRHYGPPSILMLQSSTRSIPPRTPITRDIPLSTPPEVDWRRNLPPLPPLRREDHDDMLVRSLRSLAFYHIVDEQLFWRDMIACLSDGPTRTPHYSPSLHVATLLGGCHYAQTTHATRSALLDATHKHLLSEGDRPSLSTIKAALMLGQYYAVERLIGLAWLYTGMAMRMSHMLGLSLPSSPQLSEQEQRDRNATYWSLQLYDKIWSHYFGHPPAFPLSRPAIDLPVIHSRIDSRDWTPAGVGTGVKGMQSTALHHTATLVILVEDILVAVYKPGSKLYSGKTLHTVSHLGERLGAWWTTCSAALPLPPHPGHILTLIGYYHYAMILLFRPYYLRRDSSRDATINELASAQCNAAGVAIARLFEQFDQSWGLNTAPIVWIQIGFASFATHILRMAVSGVDAAGVAAALIDAETIITHLRKLGPPFETSLQFADTMTKALQEWIPAAATGENQAASQDEVVPVTDMFSLFDTGSTFAAETWQM